jgi:hypothetical protein
MAKEFSGIAAVSNEFTPDFFVDEALGFESINGTVRITMGVVKMIEPCPPSPVQMVAIGRLIIGVEGAQRLALGLFDYLKSQGHDPRALIGSGEMAKPN